METVKGTPGSADPPDEEKKVAANQEAEARNAGMDPAVAPRVPKTAKLKKK